MAYTIDTRIDPAFLATGYNAIHWGAAVYWALLFFRSLAQVQNFSVRKAVLNTAVAAFILHAFIAQIGIILVALVDFFVNRWPASSVSHSVKTHLILFATTAIT